jgi:DNA-binding LacI/PurR family transcriptional regulator
VIKDAPIPAPAGLGKRDLVVWVAQGVLGEASGGLQVALQTFQSEALKAGWSVALAPARADMGSTAARANVIWGTVDPAGWTALTEPGRICLVVGYWPQQVQVSAVVPDYFGGGHELALRMLRCGHREVAFLHDSERVPGSDVDGQLAGCRVALEETGLSLPEALVVTCPADADWLADRLLALRPRPTAVLVSGQRLAERLTGQLKERGVGVPRALSVATFGPTGEPNPLDLTSARIDWRRAGRVVLNRLRELLSGAPIERLRISLPVEFHEGSTLSTR